MINLKIHRDPRRLAADAAWQTAEAARRAVDQQGRCSLVLAGGATPLALYERLAAASGEQAMPWRQTHLFWSDERCLPPDYAQSNYAAAQRVLLELVPVPPGNIHRIQGEAADHQAEARRYQREISAFFGDREPAFDLVLLGMGADGHTASLFPGSPALQAAGRLATAVEPGPGARPAVRRITLTLDAINRAHQVMFLVTGRAKAAAAGRILAGRDQAASAYPAARVRPRGELWWHLDVEAAGRLPTLIAESLKPLG